MYHALDYHERITLAKGAAPQRESTSGVTFIVLSVTGFLIGIELSPSARCVWIIQVLPAVLAMDLVVNISAPVNETLVRCPMNVRRCQIAAPAMGGTFRCVALDRLHWMTLSMFHTPMLECGARD